MKMSTKGRYGLRFLIDLALNGAPGNVTLKDIARRQGISEKYLWQIANPLKTAGLIHAEPGAGGGYALARAAEEITLRDVVVALEGENALVTCVDDPEACGRASGCAAREVWAELDARISEAMASFRLSDMVARQRALTVPAVLDYSI